MSDRRVSLLRALTFACGLLPGFAGAQAVPRPTGDRELIARYRADMNRIAAWIRSEEARTATLFNENRVSYLTPTSRGDVTVTTSSALIGLVAEGLVKADSMLSLTPFGGELGFPVTYRLHPPWDRRITDGDSVGIWLLDLVNAAGTESPNEWWSSSGSLPRVETLANTIAAAETKRRKAMLPPSLMTWLAGDILRSNVEDRWPTVYTSLAASSATISNACLLGSIAACRKVLRFDETADPLTEWYTPVARRRYVAQYREIRDQRKRMDENVPGGFTACVDGSDDTACTRVIRDYLGLKPWLDPLASPAGREALIVAAAEIPGAPGLRAVMGKPDKGVVASLEAIGGAKLDSLLQVWVTRVRAAEPDRVQLPAPRLLTAVTWIVLIGGLSLAGSRWRST
jgi:antibiotic biosynthesis monooxygenase (ABM) superfamily enzyme